MGDGEEPDHAFIEAKKRALGEPVRSVKGIGSNTESKLEVDGAQDKDLIGEVS